MKALIWGHTAKKCWVLTPNPTFFRTLPRSWLLGLFICPPQWDLPGLNESHPPGTQASASHEVVHR